VTANTHSTTLGTANKGHYASMTGTTNTVDNAATCLNTGSATLREDPDSCPTRRSSDPAGSASNPSSTHTFGTVRTDGTALTLGAATLDGYATLATKNNVGAGSVLTTGAVTAGGFTLGLNAGSGGARSGRSADNVGTATI